jgi:hypothetical protein
MKPPRLLSPGELAALWNLSTRQILDLCRSGRLPHLRVNDRVVRIDPEAAAKFYGENVKLAATRSKCPLSE